VAAAGRPLVGVRLDMISPRGGYPTLHKLGKALGIVRPNTDNPLVGQPNDNAIVSPDVPQPAAPRTPVDAPAVEERRSPRLDFADGVIPNPFAEQRQRAKLNEQLVAFVGSSTPTAKQRSMILLRASSSLDCIMGGLWSVEWRTSTGRLGGDRQGTGTIGYRNAT